MTGASMCIRKRSRGAAGDPRFWLVALLIVVSLAGCFSERALSSSSGGSCGTSFNPGSIVLAIQGFSFKPSAVHVRVGGTLTWVNCEPAGTPSHTSTADGGLWTSQLLDPGATFTFQFNTVGTFAYHCTPHSGMQGQVIVDP